MFSTFEYPIRNTSTGLITPTDLKRIYSINNVFNGNGITIGVIEGFVSSTLLKDLDVYSRQFGLPKADISVIEKGTKLKNDAWELESTLDVQLIHAVAPLARIVVITPNSPMIEDLISAIGIANDNGVDIISMSFGVNESSDVLKFDAQLSERIVYVASAGDNPAVCVYPASSPNCLSVGGTEVFLNDNGERKDEIAWSSGGGGVSEYFKLPVYQQLIQNVKDKRMLPDVSMIARGDESNVGVYYTDNSTMKGGWVSVKGTSIGAPVWSGIIANLFEGMNRKLGSEALLKVIYSLAGVEGYSNKYKAYFDIVDGGNYKYKAKKGYDFCTGLGSPYADKIIKVATEKIATLS